MNNAGLEPVRHCFRDEAKEVRPTPKNRETSLDLARDPELAEGSNREA